MNALSQSVAIWNLRFPVTLLNFPMFRDFSYLFPWPIHGPSSRRVRAGLSYWWRLYLAETRTHGATGSGRIDRLRWREDVRL